MKKLMLFLFLFLLSCGDGGVPVIKIDVENAIPLDTSGAEVVILQEDSVFVSNVFSNIIKTDSCYIIVGDDKIACYDFNGHFMRNAATLGKSRNEFSCITGAIVQNDSLCFIDNFQKLIFCDGQGNYLTTKMMDSDLAATSIVKFKDGYLIASGNDGAVKLLDSEFWFVCDVKSIIPVVRKPYGFHLSSYEDKEVLMNKMYERTIYSIDQNLTMREKYKLDFGSRNFPENPSMTVEMADNYVQAFSVMETDEFLFVSYYFEGFRINRYNKKEKTSVNFLVPDGYFIYMTQPGHLILFTEETNGNKLLKNLKI